MDQKGRQRRGSERQDLVVQSRLNGVNPHQHSVHTCSCFEEKRKRREKERERDGEHRTASNSIKEHPTTRNCSLRTLLCSTQHHTASHSITQHHTASKIITQHHTASHSITKQQTTQNCCLRKIICITQHYTASHNIKQDKKTSQNTKLVFENDHLLHTASHSITQHPKASHSITQNENVVQERSFALHSITQHHTASHIMTKRHIEAHSNIHHPTSPTCKFEYQGMSSLSNEMPGIQKKGLGACGCTSPSV